MQFDGVEACDGLLLLLLLAGGIPPPLSRCHSCNLRILRSILVFFRKSSEISASTRSVDIPAMSVILLSSGGMRLDMLLS